jgi:hypothetical protein
VSLRLQWPQFYHRSPLTSQKGRTILAKAATGTLPSVGSDAGESAGAEEKDGRGADEEESHLTVAG